MLVCSQHFNEADFMKLPNENSAARLSFTAVPSQKLPLRSLDKHPKQFRRPLIRKLTEPLSGKRNVTEEKDIDNVEFQDLGALCPEKTVTFKQLGRMYKLHSFNQFSNQATQSDLLNDTHFPDFHSGLCLDEVLTDNTILESFTGLPSIKFLGCLEKWIKCLGVRDKRFNAKLTVRAKIVLTMCRIKTNLAFSQLAVLFSLSEQCVSKCIHKIIPLLARLFKTVIEWSDKDEITNSMPKCFKNFSNTQVILDCTEFSVQRSHCLECRIHTYSHYKHDFTVKVLIGVTPAGVINFVSDAYGGRASDKAIFDGSCLPEMLEPHIDAVMVDKGFHIDKFCNENGIMLYRPPFKTKTQFPKIQAVENQEIASARVHVERVIQRVKHFKLLSDVIDWRLLPLIDDILIIVCGIVNLQSPILDEPRFM